MIFQEIWFQWKEIKLSILVKIKTVMMKSYPVHQIITTTGSNVSLHINRWPYEEEQSLVIMDKI